MSPPLSKILHIRCKTPLNLRLNLTSSRVGLDLTYDSISCTTPLNLRLNLTSFRVGLDLMYDSISCTSRVASCVVSCNSLYILPTESVYVVELILDKKIVRRACVLIKLGSMTARRQRLTAHPNRIYLVPNSPLPLPFDQSSRSVSMASSVSLLHKGHLVRALDAVAPKIARRRAHHRIQGGKK